MILHNAPPPHLYLLATAAVLPYVLLAVIIWVVFRTTREVS